jgi:hypothetical protein
VLVTEARALSTRHKRRRRRKRKSSGKVIMRRVGGDKMVRFSGSHSRYNWTLFCACRMAVHSKRLLEVLVQTILLHLLQSWASRRLMHARLHYLKFYSVDMCLVILCLHYTFNSFQRVRKIAKSSYWPRHVFRLSAWNSSAPTGRIFVKFDI